MSESALFASFLIGLREGLEATLVVSILVAFLVKSDRRNRLPWVGAGVVAAVALSVGFGALLTYTGTTLLADYRQRELFEAVASVAAVCFVTAMIFWMRRAARSLGGDLRAGLDRAVAVGPVAVVLFAFLAVAREGLETALLFFAAVQGATANAGPLLAITGGVAAAVVIGVLLYATAVRIDLGRFFTVTGVLLILVAAGILKYGVHDFQEAGVLPGLNDTAFDVSGVLDPSGWLGTLLAGTFNITPAPTVLETIAYPAYAVPALAFFLAPRRRTAPGTPAAAAPATATPGTSPTPAATSTPVAGAADAGPDGRPTGVPGVAPAADAAPSR